MGVLGFAVGFLGREGITWYAPFLVEPFSEVDKLAALTTEWTPSLLWVPDNKFATGRAGDFRDRPAHIKQVLKVNSTSRSI